MPTGSFTDAEMLTAVGHLENYGYVKRLRTSKGELRILLQPERLNNLASSFVLEARRNPKGLGALEEKRLLAGGYDFPELKDLHEGERDVLLDSAALLFLEHNVCFRETDPLRMEPYLVFPELINLKKPPEEEQATEDGVAYTVSGPTENVFASLVVLLGYTHTFTRTAQWQNNARYEVGDGLVCGFRQEAERDGELDFVLCFGPKVGLPVRTLFQGLFESFLARRNLTVMRYEPVRCTSECGHLLDRAVVREAVEGRKDVRFLQRMRREADAAEDGGADPVDAGSAGRSGIATPRRRATDTLRAGRLPRARLRGRAEDHAAGDASSAMPGACPSTNAGSRNGSRRICRRRGSTWCWTGGTTRRSARAWRGSWSGSRRATGSSWSAHRSTGRKYEEQGHLPRATSWRRRWDLIGNPAARHRRSEANACCRCCSTGEESESFPPLLHGRVYADFRDEDAYFTHGLRSDPRACISIPPNHPAVADLRESLRGPEMR